MSKKTLWVMRGPLAASPVCAKKRNTAVRMTSNDIDILCRDPMVEGLRCYWSERVYVKQ